MCSNGVPIDRPDGVAFCPCTLSALGPGRTPVARYPWADRQAGCTRTGIPRRRRLRLADSRTLGRRVALCAVCSRRVEDPVGCANSPRADEVADLQVELN